MVFPYFLQLCLNFEIRSWWSETQLAVGLVFADCIELLHLWRPHGYWRVNSVNLWASGDIVAILLYAPGLETLGDCFWLHLSLPSHPGNSHCSAAAAAAKSLQLCLTLRPQRWQPTRLPCPWDSPGNNTGVGCHFLLQCMKVKSESEVSQSCPTVSDLMNCSPRGSSVHGIFQAIVLEWGAIAFSSIVLGNFNLTITLRFNELLCWLFWSLGLFFPPLLLIGLPMISA